MSEDNNTPVFDWGAIAAPGPGAETDHTSAGQDPAPAQDSPVLSREVNTPAPNASTGGASAFANLPPFPAQTAMIVGRLPIQGDTGKAIIQLPAPVKDVHCAFTVANTGVLSDCTRTIRNTCVPTVLRSRPLNDREFEVLLDGGDYTAKGLGWSAGTYPGRPSYPSRTMCREGYSPPPLCPAVWCTTIPRTFGWGPWPRDFHPCTTVTGNPVRRAMAARSVRYGTCAPPSVSSHRVCARGGPGPCSGPPRGLWGAGRSGPLVFAGPVLRAAPAVDPHNREDLHVRGAHVDGAGLGSRARVGPGRPAQALGGVVAPVEQDLELAVVEGAGPQHRGHARVTDGAGAVTEHAGVGDGERAVHILDGRGQLDDGLTGVALDG